MTDSATNHQASPVPAIETIGLGRRYRRGWALRDTSFRLPAGRVCALVGPNGAGKTTLLSLAADLITPTTGTITLSGHRPGSAWARRSTAFLSQHKALYPRFRVHEILRMGEELNPGWHQETAESVVEAGGIPMNARIGTLSGGQSTRVAFALALGKRPQLMLLDEPMADLDPLVRHQMTDLLQAQARQNHATVVMSSHLVSELESACDYLVLVNHGTVRLAGEVDLLLAEHRRVTTMTSDHEHHLRTLDGHDVIATSGGIDRITSLVRTRHALPEHAEHRPPTLEDLVLGYLRAPDAPSLLTASARVVDIEVAV
ncbi:ABC transporter ATP-binding protein [Streptomyces sp. NBC_01707]|jgi:ABC-2 type transport system ATP-binding protein|uniref:ABC transporter ATP-binding protein n=1 Tax=unclassified Streptomyces TaxID=2593676 RepID=UPI00089207C2|nr:ABC transporter ATP-binding protein [Streptomyces sp. 136MFCol5.1]SCZ16450.1 ABC-2 type transport system ATP-binding protein [Streptomyces sp. 136MFCol5.1]